MPFSRKGLLFDARGGDRTAKRAGRAPDFARTLGGAVSAPRRRRGGARARRRFPGRLHRRRLQPRDALALARRPCRRHRRLRAALAAAAEDRLGGAAVRDWRRGGLRAPLPARALPLARPGELGRDRGHGRGEEVRADTRRPLRRELLPDATCAPVHRLGQARGPARRDRPLPHAAPARHGRTSDRCRLLRALPRVAASTALGLPRRPASRGESRDVHDQPPCDAREHRRPRARRGVDPVWGLRERNELATFLGGIVSGLGFYVYYPARVAFPIWVLFLVAVALLYRRRFPVRWVVTAGRSRPPVSC